MEKPFNKILVANRGEIAVRIISAARELGISVATIYSSADREALHVKLADEAYEIGPPEPLKSYLAMDKIVDLALKIKAEAIHPGYGFLSENPRFAEIVEKNNLVFIGPSAKTLSLVGDKIAAKRTAKAVGVKGIPGTLKPVDSIEDGLNVAEQIGYPVMLKPAGGGGGIGMKIVRSPQEFPSAFEVSQREATAAFGDPRIYIEKCLENPRHIEIQILADIHGKVVYLGERECSIQRRHQKLIEESPSPIMNQELRERMGKAAIKVAKATKYRNAGTVEFLYKNGDFYFMEVNARLQVEHGVTELVTGIDIVKQQIMLSAGQELEMEQDDIEIRGWAIEARINCEDPTGGFAPSPGKILMYHEPGGPGVRVDSGVYEGYDIPRHYDPLISKVIVWGLTREEAIARMRRALSEYIIVGDGVKTNIPFHMFVFNDKEFIRGIYDTSYLSGKQDEIISYLSELERKHAFIAAYTLYKKNLMAVKTIKPSIENIPENMWWKYSGLVSLVKPWYKK